jgi:hypothetical protein
MILGGDLNQSGAKMVLQAQQWFSEREERAGLLKE